MAKDAATTSAPDPTPARSPDPSPPLSPAPLGRITLTVTDAAWSLGDGNTVLCTITAAAQSFGAGSSGSLTLTARDRALDHLGVGDTLNLLADPRMAQS